MATIDVAGSRRHREVAAQRGMSQRAVGGVAAIIEGVCYAGGLAMFLLIMPAMGWQMGYWDDPSKSVLFVRAHETFFIAGGLFFAIQALIVLPVVLAAHERLHSYSPGLATAATGFGAMGAAMLLLNALVQYAEFQNISSLSTAVAEQAQAYGNIAYDATIEAASLCLGLWMLLLSGVAIRERAMPRWFGFFGLLAGISNVAVLAFPPPSQLISIAWFIALGVVLLRGGSHAKA